MNPILPVAFIGIWLLATQAGLGQTTEGKAGSIEGRVTFEGAIPKESTSDENGLRDDLISVDPGSRGLLNAVVYLEAESSGAKGAFAPAQMDQINHRFVPRVLAVRTGQTVFFTNSDPANHNVRTSSLVASNEFNVFTGNEGSYQRVFAANVKQQPVRVGCDIHPWMRGWIYVFEHSYFAVTDARGEFRIREVPPGEYRLHVVQPDLGHKEQQKVVVKPGETCKVKAVAKQRTAAGS